MKPLKIVDRAEGEMLSCGECTACCTVFEIEEIKKPDRTPCQHLCGTGCGIYETRPKMCKEFYCLWVQSLLFDGKEKYRPDKFGAVVIVMSTPPFTGMFGVFPIDHNKGLPPRVKTFLWELQKRRMYFDGAAQQVIGPLRLLNEWKKKWNVKTK